MICKDKIDAAKAIQRIAKKEGITGEAVCKEMKFAMLVGLCSQDPEIQARWGKVPCKGEIPTPEELITYLAVHIDKTINSFL